MKTNRRRKLIPVLLNIILSASLAVLNWCPSANAQTVQYVTLYSSGHATNQYELQTNQIISIVGTSSANATSPGVGLSGNAADGTSLLLMPGNAGSLQMVTGLTNIALLAANTTTWATIQITTPATGNVVSNYLPADAIVIPANVTGTVQIILESSTDLINWTAAMPGTYAASSATNRFFRVRAVQN